MSDRELLEAAARAAGIDGWWSGDDLCFGFNGNKNVPVPWRPLADDGDALRLAVKLRLCVDAGASMWWGDVTYISGQHWKRLGCTGFGEETHGDDPMGATRRAIVRAAAWIGRAAAETSRAKGGSE